MKYLVLQSEHSINFVVFNGPGHHLSVAGEKSMVPYYVRQHVNIQSGAFSINEVSDYSGGSFFILTNSGCNIYVEDALLPQGISVMEKGQKFVIAKLTMFLIDEDEKSDVEADCNTQKPLDDHHEDDMPFVEENWNEDDESR